MTRREVALILAAAAARDNRTIGDTDVLAWHEDIGDLDYDDAREAVSRHYRESTDRLMPAHVRRHATDIDRDRRRQAREADERLALAAAAADPTRYDRSEQTRALIAQLRASLPAGDPDALRRPEWVAHERRKLRAVKPVERNPYYDPAVAARAATESEAS